MVWRGGTRCRQGKTPAWGSTAVNGKAKARTLGSDPQRRALSSQALCKKIFSSPDLPNNFREAHLTDLD